MTDAVTGDHDVVLFDGACNLCNASVNFVIDRDRAGRFRFAALQSAPGRALLARHGLDPGALDSVVLIAAGRAHVESDAALRIARGLDGAWPLLAALLAVPRALRDPVYRFVARRRDRWFGRGDACRLPTAALRGRFLA